MNDADFREIFELSPAAMITCNQEGIVLLANSAAREMLPGLDGRPKDRRIEEFFTGEHRSLIRAACHGFPRAQGFTLDTRLAETPEATVRLLARSLQAPRGDILFSVQPLPTERPSPPAGATENPERPDGLVSLEQRLWKIFRTSPIGLCISRMPDGPIVEVNDSFLEMLGYRREEVIGRTSDELDLWVDQNHSSRILSLLNRSGQIYGEEFPFRTRDGEIRYGLCFYDTFEVDGKRHVLAEIQDITQRKQAEEAVLESQQRMEALFSNALDAILLLDNEATIIEANPAACQLAGRSYEQILDTPVWQLSDESAETLPVAWQQFLRQGQMQGELRIVRHEGQAVEAEHRSVANFVPGLHMMVLRDVTDRNQAERQRRESQADLRALFDSSVQGVILIDREGIVRDFNIKARELVEMIRGGAGRLEPGLRLKTRDPEGQIAFQQDFARAVAGETISRQWQFQRIDGQEMWLSLNYTPVFAEQDRVEGVCLSLLDITENKEAERQLRAARDQLESIIESLPYATFVIDNDGVILAWNRALEELTGTRKEEMVGKDNYEYAIPFYGQRRMLTVDLIDTRDEQIERRYDVFRRSGKNIYTEIYVPAVKGGKGAHLAGTASPLYDSNGNRTGSIESIQDITPRKEAEEQLRQSEEQLRHAQRMESVGRLAGGIAHDFNNQMTVVEGYCDLLLREIGEDSEVSEALMEIRKASGRATRLTSQLLTFSRRQVLRPELLDLQDVLAEIQNPLSRMIGEDVDLQIISPDELGRVLVDQNQFQQIVMNLAINARDAMPTGGKLTLELADVEIDSDYLANQPDALPGRYVLLSVRDTGVGMDEATKEHVFDPFFTTKPVGQGTGLGLAMVYGFVSQSGGFVDLNSQPGKGTEFRIYLPREDCPESPAYGQDAPQRSHLPQQQSGTILVVEDEQRVRRLITQVLQRCGYSVHQVSDVDAAEEFLAQSNGTTDLVITDVVMPGRSGLDLAEHIRKSTPELPILFISGYAHDTVLQHGEGRMPERLLAKPFTPQQLAQTVKEVLEE